jgi:GDP-L-fucose synthase
VKTKQINTGLEKCIYVAGHGGLVGSALVRELRRRGLDNIATRSHAELDLADQS